MARAPESSDHALAATEVATRHSVVTTAGPSLEDRGFAERYETHALLGAGGMGEVHLCRDARVGRDVAMKMIQPHLLSDAERRARFVREARVQGQLEHPAIVPVYDIGLTPDGSAYFTMKRVQGIAFDDVIERLRAGTEKRTTRQLLAAFSSLCQAIDFAHAHGVVHRDLKPANLMLGDFGETYVLDWGLAKVGSVAEPAAGTVETAGDAGEVDVKTLQGEMMGTPGYMAPEQARGLDVDPRADVYALGAVLFELLALETLHPRRSVPAIIGSTLVGTDARPSVRAPDRDIPPELDAICVRATALEPADRLTARELSDAIERYLDGDRDLARRRELSVMHAEMAMQAGGDDLASRQRAMRELGRALALDPENTMALRTLAGLLLSPPKELPPEAEAAIRNAQDDAVRVAARAGGFARLGMLFVAPLALWMGIRDLGAIAAIIGSMLLAAALAFVNSRMRRPRTFIRDVELTASVLATMSLAWVFGPYVLVPTAAAITGVAFSLNAFTTVERIKILGMSCLSVIIPAMLELAGVWGPSTTFDHGVMTIAPQAVEISAVSSVAFLVTSSCAMVAAAVLYGFRMRTALSDAERQLQMQSWHLQQLVPAAQA